MKLFLFTWALYDEIKRQDVVDFIDSLSYVTNWRAADGVMFLVCESSAKRLNDDIVRKFPNLRHMIAPINITEIEGLTDEETWDFIRTPREA